MIEVSVFATGFQNGNPKPDF